MSTQPWSKLRHALARRLARTSLDDASPQSQEAMMIYWLLVMRQALREAIEVSPEAAQVISDALPSDWQDLVQQAIDWEPEKE